MSSVLRYLRAPRRRHKSEDGQILIVAAAGLVMMLTFAALAIDIGFLARARRDAQNDADAMALAGARELPNQANADAIAMQWATKNNVTVPDVESVAFGQRCDGSASGYDTITVHLKRNQGTFLASVIGVSSNTLRVCATARVGVGLGGDDLLPFGFLEEDPYPGPNPEDSQGREVCYFYDDAEAEEENTELWSLQQCLIKIPQLADSYAAGNSGAARLDEYGGTLDPSCNVGSSGTSEYVENIDDGSECVYAIGDEIRPKTGNMRQPTCSTFEDMLAANTDSLTDVFGTPDADGVYGPVDRTSPRFGLIPRVTVFGSGASQTVTITGFLTVYIVGACDDETADIDSDCDGNGNDPACVAVIPVKSNVYMAGVKFAGGGLGDDSNAIRTIKLID